MMMHRFMLPVRVDTDGWVQHKECAVQTELIPLFAEIVGAASRPFTVRQHYAVPASVTVRLDEQMLEGLRDSIRYDLEHGMRDSTQKKGQCIITPVTHTEATVDGDVVFTATAVAMRLLHLPEGFAL